MIRKMTEQKPGLCHFQQKYWNALRLYPLITRILLIWGILFIFSCSKHGTKDDYLIRVRNSTVTVAQFNQILEAASEEAFPGEQEISPKALNDLRMRVLNQLTEELIITERAKDLNLRISETELNQAVEAIKADYPDNTFEETLLENAVSFEVWKQKLMKRLLVQKVIAKELVDKVQITREDVEAYYKRNYPQGPPEGEDMDTLNARIVKHLRQQKAEQAYKDWLDELRKTIPVELNQKQWNRLMVADS